MPKNYKNNKRCRKKQRRRNNNVKTIKIKYSECLNCVKKFPLNKLYGHTCNNLVCGECIFKNFLIYQRSKCSYCRTEYTKSQVMTLYNVYKKEFDLIDDMAMSHIMKTVNTTTELFEICSNQIKFMMSYPELSKHISNIMDSLTLFIMTVQIPFILALCKTGNIMIIDGKYIMYLMRYKESDDFIRSLNIKGFALSDQECIQNNMIPIFNLPELKKMISVGGNVSVSYIKAIGNPNQKNIFNKLERIDEPMEILIKRCVAPFEQSEELLIETKHRIITLNELNEPLQN